MENAGLKMCRTKSRPSEGGQRSPRSADGVGFRSGLAQGSGNEHSHRRDDRVVGRDEHEAALRNLL